MIRPATTGDAGELARVFIAAWRGSYRGVVADAVIDGLDIDGRAQSFADRLSVGDPTSIVWDDGSDGILGFALFGADKDNGSISCGYLASLYVDPAASGHGIGTALLTEAIGQLTAAGRTDVGLWVFAGNQRARKLYERAGFEPTGKAMTDPQWGAEQLRYRRGAHRTPAGMIGATLSLEWSNASAAW